jgi:hypothetical protein
MTTKAEETLNLISSFVASSCSGGGKTIAAKLGPEKLDKITATHAMSGQSIFGEKFCNNLVHFETIFMVNAAVTWLTLGKLLFNPECLSSPGYASIAPRVPLPAEINLLVGEVEF